MTYLHWLTLIAGGIVLVLAAVAAYFLIRVKRQDRQQRQQFEDRKTEQGQQRAHVIKSIRMIAQGMIDEQMTLTEGAIRIRVLLDALVVSDETRESYAAFYLLSDATDHIPILDGWKKLSTREKLGFDLQREQLENDHREFVLDAAQRILKAPL